MAARNYAHLSHEELIRLLEARDRRDATRFGLVWESNDIERDQKLNQDFVALDLDEKLSCGDEPWRNLVIEGDNLFRLRQNISVHWGLAFLKESINGPPSELEYHVPEIQALRQPLMC